ncbi:MAG TPA: TolC family protein [Bryobacterales bacterium]|nr:TolC family protein [Bryobacterales bacterium]
MRSVSMLAPCLLPVALCLSAAGAAPPAGPERPAETPARQALSPAAGPPAGVASGPPAAPLPGPVVETRTLTLQQAVGLALKQNPDYLLAKLDEQKARQAVREANIPFVTKIYLGSGLAKGNGFPLSIEGSAPSIMQAYASRYIYNRPQSFRVKEAGEMANAALHSTEAKSDEVAYQVAATYLDFERATRALPAAKTQVETLTRMQELMEERVKAGREIPLEATKARVEAARARSLLLTMQANVALLEEALRDDLSLGDAVRIAPVETNLPSELAMPESEDAAVAEALGNSQEIKRLQSVLQAKRYALTAEKSARFPHVDLVAQYALLAQYNNYQDFFKTFQRHNGELGASIQMPIFNGGAIAVRVAQVQTEISQTNLRLASARAGIALETKRLFQTVRQAESSRDLARMELDLARESLSVSLARFDEGRIPFSEVEQARITEAQKWEAFYDGRAASGKARLNLLREMGTLVAALR